MTRTIGSSAYGVRAPIIKQGDDLAEIVVDILVDAFDEIQAEPSDRDVVAITESLLARAQGNFCSIEDVSKDLNSKFDNSIGILFPITSRNRFSLILKAAAETGKKIIVFLKIPVDEVGNRIIDEKSLVESGINPYSETISEEEYRDIVGPSYKHEYTGIDYVDFYKSLAVNDNIEIYLSNNPLDILNYTDEILISSVHHRDYLYDLLKTKAKNLYTLADIMAEPIDESGYNEDFGLYGSNLSGNDKLKLFPRNSQEFVYNVQERVHRRIGVAPEVMVYGDGAFKDPVTGIWEFADPVVAPAYTENLKGRPTEYKLKYLADNTSLSETSSDIEEAIKEKIKAKKDKGDFDISANESLGTTPRQITDLLGSLADLVSGSGDKGTPIVLIKGYFDDYAAE